MFPASDNFLAAALEKATRGSSKLLRKISRPEPAQLAAQFHRCHTALTCSFLGARIPPQNDTQDWIFDPPGAKNAVKKRARFPGPK